MSDDTHDLTPGPSDDDLAAISALVDGTATADERLRVESSPEWAAEWAATAERWREHRSALADPAVVVPPDRIRVGAIAAAMAVFDGLHGDATGGTVGTVGTVDDPATDTARTGAAPAPVIRLDSRRRAMRVVTGAAAAVAVLFVGAAVIGNGFGGGTDEDSASVEFDDAAGKVGPTVESDAAEAAPAAVDTETAAATQMADPAAATGADVESTESGASQSGATEDAITLEAPESPDVSQAAAETTVAASGGGVDEIGGPAEVSVTLASPEQLLDYARSRPPQLPLPGLEFPCVSADIEALGTAEYRGIQVVVTRAPDTGTIEAVDLTTCATIESVTP